MTRPCPDIAKMGDHACGNRDQCWEPCGELGKSEAHVRAAQRRESAGVLINQLCKLGFGAPVIDLGELQWAEIQQAALQSKWIPPQYYSNDWVSDVCRFLREGPEAFLPAAREASCDSPMAPAAALTERHESEPGGKNEQPLPKGLQDVSPAAPLSVELRDGAIHVTLPITTLQAAVQAAPFFEHYDEGAQTFLEPVVTDAAAFAAEVVRALNAEIGEDGTTLVHQMFDRAFEEAVESGADGIVMPGDREYHDAVKAANMEPKP